MREADVKGPAAHAWLLKKPENPIVKDWLACVRSYILNGPGFHPAWAWWQVSVISLRDIPGVLPAKKQYPQAEYEFMIISFNPDRGTPDVDLMESGMEWGNLSKPKFLFPLDFVYQFHGVNEECAEKLCTAAVQAIVSGYISPDQDYRSIWKKHIEETIRCMANGHHDGAKIVE